MSEVTRLDKVALNESEHFMPCGSCGQFFDLRDLDQLIYHERPNHKPIPEN